MARNIFNPLDHLEISPRSSSLSSGSGTAIFSPLADVEVAAGPQISTSAFYNQQVGICPKCGTGMTTSKIQNGDTVFFCTKDRVALPRPDQLVA